ncbi:MAG TPA: FAD-dependent oxidoreductase, partial [Candidatus Deferrimicrobiaceae bacterium]|nr:FAD-dependent oxidoreductase [Candidatus Deferrimicrobiaceae bacterium]
MATGASTADAVVIGSGAFGAATAYHLARRGLEVTLVDQHALGSQTSPRAAGLTSKADPMPTMARLRHEACEAFERFEGEMGRGVEFHRSGSLRAAYTEAAVERVRIAQETAHACGIEARLVDAAEAERLAPHFKPGAARRILHVPSDGWVDPAKVAIGFATRAGELGARLLPFTAVQGLLSEGGRATGVVTPRGEIRAPVVVDAAGGWTARVAAGAGIALPLIPVRHQLFVT